MPEFFSLRAEINILLGNIGVLPGTVAVLCSFVSGIWQNGNDPVIDGSFGDSGVLYDDTDRLLNTTENLLVATRLETGRDSFKMRPERVDGVLRAAVAQLGRQASEHKLSVVVNDQALTAVMAPELIRRVLINIMNNAIQYTPAGSAIELRAEHPGRGERAPVRLPLKKTPAGRHRPAGRRERISPPRAPTRNSGSRPLRCASE